MIAEIAKRVLQGLNLTGQQDLIFRLASENQSIAVSAGAGTGKTFLARLVAHAIANTSRSVEEIPFNKAVQVKASEFWKSKRLAVNAQTVHSRGIKMLYGAKLVKGSANTNEGATGKTGRLVSQVEGDKIEKHRAELIGLVDKMRIEGVGIDCLSDIAMEPEDVAVKYQLCLDKVTGEVDAELLTVAKAIVAECDDVTREGFEFDFIDMIRLPIVHGLTRFLPDTTLVVLDEVQDYNVIMFGFLRECLVPSNCQVFMIGDFEAQALMQFAGARPDLFTVIADHYRCQRQRLSTNFRCSHAVIDYANGRLTDDLKLSACDDAPQGAVEMGIDVEDVISQIEDGEESGEGQAILCKVNAPLIAMAVRLIIADIPFSIRMEKLAKPILGLIWKLDGYKNKLLFGDFKTGRLHVPVGQMHEKMRESMERIAREAGAEMDSVLTPEEQDILQCIQSLEIAALAKGITTMRKTPYGTKAYVGHPIFQILDLMTSGKSGITLSTGHIAKGMEWNTVYILPNKQRDLKTEWEIHQDFCLTHVMETRAIERMIFLADPEGESEVL